MFHLHRRRLILGLTCAALAALCFAGCSSGSGPASEGRGSLRIAVAWPAAGARMIPANTASLKITVTGNTAGLSAPAAQTLAIGVASASFPGLIPGAYTVVVGAYPNGNGTGQLLALGANTNAVVKANTTTTVNIALASQVVSVTVALTPSTTDDVAAHTVTATLTGWTQAGGLGSIVPVDPTKVTWASGTPAVATVQSTVGNGVPVVPVNAAATSGSKQVVITGRYRELPVDQSASATLTVNHAAGTGVLDVTVSRH